MTETAPHPDLIEDAPMSTTLHGLEIEYRYSTGNHYKLTFDHDYNVGFTFLNQMEREGRITPTDDLKIPYRAREIRPGLTQLHWIIKDADIHVSLLFDFDAKKIFAAAMMPPNKWEFWDNAEILNVTEHPAG